MSWKPLKRWLRYWLIRVALWKLSLFPLRVASAFGAWVGWLVFFAARRERKKALTSLATAFPDMPGEARWDLALQSFAHLGRCVFELACIRQVDRDIEVYVQFPKEARAVLDKALERKKGVLFVTGHVGQWELLARRIALLGYPSQTIARESTDGRLTALIQEFRASAGLKSIWRGREGAARGMLRALRGGEILGMLIDQDTSVQSVFVPFFGKLASTPRAAAELALHTGASVVMGFCQRENGQYVISMRQVPLPENPENEEAVVHLTATMTAAIEEAIQQHPEQWVWMHQRWKTQPQT